MRFLLLLSLSLLALGCSKENKPCPKDGNCGDGLSCEKYSKTCKKVCAKPSDCSSGKTCEPESGVCLTRAEIKCGRLCKKYGGCGLVGGECKVIKDEHCEQSDVCKVDGRCSYDGESECSATKDEDCANSLACKRDGKCSYNGEYSCIKK